MPSPFPGMNPYLEHPNIWHDFHGALAFRLRDALAREIGPGYFVKVDERIYIHELSADERRLHGRPDVGIAHDGRDGETTSSATLVNAPMVLRHQIAIDEVREPYLQIIDSKSRDIVTVIEIISPSNKVSDRDQYLAKRHRILRTPTHLVEIDLLRGGTRMPELERGPKCDYAIMVSRAEQRPDAGFWLFGVRDAIPQIPFPLRENSNLTIDLKQLIEEVSDSAHYEREIYVDPITPPLTDEDAVWARSLISEASVFT